MLQELKRSIRDIPDFPKPGIVFRDLGPVLSDSKLCNFIVNALCEKISDHKIDAIAGIESRGFLFGMSMAQELGVGFIPVRKKGKLPGETFGVAYQLEYGSADLEIQKEAISEGMRIHIHDDLIATGGSADAASKLVHLGGGKIASFSFVIELLDLNGRNLISSHGQLIESLIEY